MKSRRYLNVGPSHDPEPGEFFDERNHDWFIEVDLGAKQVTHGSNIIEFPDDNCNPL